jgi:hypothetical protein
MVDSLALLFIYGHSFHLSWLLSWMSLSVFVKRSEKTVLVALKKAKVLSIFVSLLHILCITMYRTQALVNGTYALLNERLEVCWKTLHRI